MNQQGQCTHKRYVSQMCTISTQLLHQIKTETYFGSLYLSNYVGNGFPTPTIDVYLPCPCWPWGLPTLPFIQYSFSRRRGGAKRPGREAGLWVMPTTITIQGTLQAFLPSVFHQAATTVPFQTLCYIAHMDSVTTQHLLPYTISLGDFQVKGTKVHCTTRQDMTCAVINLWSTLMKAGWWGLQASVNLKAMLVPA
jgi:hypothetical protein